MELSRIDFALMKVLQSRNCTAYFSGMTMQELISVVGISRSAAYRRLNRLITEGYIEKACKSINADTFCITQGKMLALLYTGDDKENWDCERLEDNYLMAYVVNFTVPEYSEFGDIFIEGFGDSGALVRVDVEHVI